MKCSVLNCDRKMRGGAQGFCNSHYTRLRRYGSVHGGAAPRDRRTCSLPGCNERHRSKGLCSTHYNQAYYVKPENRNRINHSFNGQHSSGKRSAKVRGLSWELTKEQHADLIAGNFCYYDCGNPLPNTGSALDRLDNTKGYTLDNVVPCCTSCNNSRKDNYSPAEWRVMIAALIAFRGVK